MSVRDELLPADDFEAMPVSAALERVGRLIDASVHVRQEDGLERAIKLAETLRPRLASPVDEATLDFFEANAWRGIRELSGSESRDVWDWEQPELEKEILWLRRAAGLARADGMPAQTACRIFTNLGNAFDTVGRFAEALRYWDQALLMAPGFSMARGNRAIGLESYGRLLYDKRHAAIFLKCAHRELRALGPDVEPHAVASFESMRQRIEAALTPEYLASDFAFGRVSLGKTKAERTYRQWCLRERLFLNSLNDVDTWQVAARDVFHLPSVVTGIDEGPYYHGFFNQMKQEFASARYLLHSGLASRHTHFSDREVLLHNTLDYPKYGLAVEKVKLAFRAAYSLFDKMAYFLNQYFSLGIREQDVSFRRVWYRRANRGNGLALPFERCANLPLRGLFWVSKDLFEEKPGFREAIEPAAGRLTEVRNHIEHRYLKVHDMMVDMPSGSADTLAYSVKCSDFEEMTITLFRLVRASLFYLSLAVGVEERRQAEHRGPGDVVPPMFLDRFEDEWKR
jgi:tetratricopeptide (TPR) repeat protein